MKKRIIALISIITILLVYICTAIGCTSEFLPKAEKLRYVEYIDQNGKMYAKGVTGATPWYGYIVINDKKIPAYFNQMFPDTSIGVTILEKDIPEGFNNWRETSFYTSDLNEQNQLISEENVVLYGENFGQIVLVMNQLEKEDFEVWELPWQAQMIDDWKLLSLNVTDFYSYAANDKYVSMSVRKTMYSQQEYFIFKWLPDTKGFEIYQKEEDQVKPTEGQQPIATGTYVLQDDVVTLAFVTDGLFYGAYPTVELTLNVN